MDERPSVAEPVKDEHAAHPVAEIWREPFRQIVRAFVQGDYGLRGGVASVKPPSRETADRIRSYVAAYGETLAPLPDATWSTSIAQWMGPCWEVLVDLFTVESGPSDLVLSARVFETGAGFRIEIGSVHVP